MGRMPKIETGQTSIAEKDVKICELCGTLNHNDNNECYICAWRGAFSTNPATVHAAWLRLYDQFESVLIEHVTARRVVTLGHLGVARKGSRWQVWCAAMKLRCQSLFPKRRTRTNDRIASPPTQAL